MTNECTGVLRCTRCVQVCWMYFTVSSSTVPKLSTSSKSNTSALSSRSLTSTAEIQRFARRCCLQTNAETNNAWFPSSRNAKQRNLPHRTAIPPACRQHLLKNTTRFQLVAASSCFTDFFRDVSVERKTLAVRCVTLRNPSVMMETTPKFSQCLNLFGAFTWLIRRASGL